MQILKINIEEYENVVKHCQRALPNEACGIMAGEITGDKGIVKKVYFTENSDVSPESYFMEPDEQFNIFRNMRENNLELISIFHSHPETPARPSGKDIEMAFYPEAIYAIISFKNVEPVLKAYLIKDKKVRLIEVLLN